MTSKEIQNKIETALYVNQLIELYGPLMAIVDEKERKRLFNLALIKANGIGLADALD